MNRPVPFHRQRRALPATKANATAPLSKPLEQPSQDLTNVGQQTLADPTPSIPLASRTLETGNLCYMYARILELIFTKATLYKLKPEDTEIHTTAGIC